MATKIDNKIRAKIESLVILTSFSLATFLNPKMKSLEIFIDVTKAKVSALDIIEANINIKATPRIHEGNKFENPK